MPLKLGRLGSPREGGLGPDPVGEVSGGGTAESSSASSANGSAASASIVDGSRCRVAACSADSRRWLCARHIWDRAIMR